MVAMSTLQVRQGPTHDSALVETCHKILPGSLVRVGAKEMLSFKEKLMTKPVNETRMHIELDGDQEPLGWVTGISRDEIETLKLASRGFPLMKTIKSCVVRESTGREDGSEATKIGEVPKDTSVRIMETIVLADGTEKALISKDGVVASAYGWIVTKIPGKAKGEEDQTLLVPATPLPISFNLAVHTANSLMRVLSGKAGKVCARGLHARVPRRLPLIAPDCHSGKAGKVRLDRVVAGDQSASTASPGAHHGAPPPPLSGRERHQAPQGRRRPPKRRGGQASQVWRPGRSDHLAPLPSEHACAHHGAPSSPQVRPPRGMPSLPSRRPSRWSSTASMRPSRSPAGPVRSIHSRSFPLKSRLICSSSRIARRRCADCL